MNRIYSYLNSAVIICNAYDGGLPFAIYLKQYFSLNKKFGSKDRKQVGHLCYCFFRMGKSLPALSIDEKIIIGLFLCSTESNELLSVLNNEWNEKANFNLEEKIKFLNLFFSLESIFPWKTELSEGIIYEEFYKSFLIQPDLFIRVRPSYNEKVISKLDLLQINYELISSSAIRLSNSFKVDQHFVLDKEVVIQDFNSQQTGKIIQEVIQQKENLEILDCCAGSGGKSIMTYDFNPSIQLTVSDIRKSILINLTERFRSAGVSYKHSFVTDLSKQSATIKNKFDFIIADVPCSGSGTWSRTPEQICFFEKKEIDKYTILQKQIVTNCVSKLKPGGHLLYITCSVFKKENEEVVNYIKETLQLQLIKTELLHGYNKKADTLFVALFSASTI